MTKIQKVPTGTFHPGYGCAILVIGILTFGGIVSWVLYSGYEQDRQISGFTVVGAPPLEVAKPAIDEKDALKARLADFSKTLAAGQPATLTFTLADINALVLICGETGIADYRGIVHFTGMDAASQALKADIRWQINNLPFTERKERFLVGQAIFKPALDTHSLELRISEVTVPGKTVSEGFVNQLREWPWLNLAKTRPEISAALASIAAFKVTPEGTLVLEGKPASKPAATAK